MISDQITLINQTVLECLKEPSEVGIVKAFTEVGLKVLQADFGFVWLNSAESSKLELVYQSSNLTFKPHAPRRDGRNHKVIESSVPDFVTSIEKTPDAHYLKKYIKSFVIIPLTRKDTVYGTMVLCFKKEEPFSNNKRTLSVAIGNNVAQAITIKRLVSSEQEARLDSERHEAYFRALIENSYEVIILIDEKGKIIYISPSVYKVFGYKAEFVVGKKVGDFVYQQNPEKIVSYFEKILKVPEQTHVVELHYTHSDGSVCTMESTALNLLKNPNIKGIVLNVRDITEQKKAVVLREAQLLFKEEKLKNEFIANATHEFRTPLAIIKGNTELGLLEKDSTVKSMRSTLKAINIEVDHLSCLVSDMGLLTNQVKSLQSVAKREKLNLTKLITGVVKRVKVLAKDKKISVNFIKNEDMFVKGDAWFLDKLFINLLKNSITYGKQDGLVNVDITKTDTEVQVRIEDNGIGISSEDLPYIFERFYRADKARTGNESGTGLGLAIVKLVVSAHGGDVQVESSEGTGTTFVISLPLLS